MGLYDEYDSVDFIQLGRDIVQGKAIAVMVTNSLVLW
jgi:hypothetical protein